MTRRGKIKPVDFSLEFQKNARCDRCRNLLSVYSKHRGIPVAFSINTKMAHGWRCIKCVTTKSSYHPEQSKGKYLRTYDQVDDFLVMMICSIVRNEPYDKMDAYLIKKLKQVIGVETNG